MQNMPGFYGKFPDLGDFVNRRLANEFIHPWDEWLQQSVAASRDQLGDTWLDCYLTSPIWRFAISGGLCGESPWIGLMMPSVDRVGRYFPLTLACKLPQNANLMQAVTVGSNWFDMADEILLAALQDTNFEMEAFDARVAALGSLDELLVPPERAADIGFGTSWQIGMSNTDLAQPLATLSHQLLQQRLGAYSLWWGGGSENVAPSMLVCADLPPASDYAAMLNGDWGSGTWEQWPSPASNGDSFNDHGQQFTL